MKQRKARSSGTPIQGTLPCRISRGIFSSERGVRVTLPTGREVCTIVDKEHVHPDQDVPPGQEIEGRVNVRVVELREDSALVDLPQPAVMQGTRIEIPRTMLE